jgi:SRSO17 transposase
VSGFDELGVAEVAESVFGVVMASVAARFPRWESRRQARLYARGLASGVERKNSWELAEQAGDASPDRMQQLLTRAAWDDAGVRVDVRQLVVEYLGVGGVLIVDESGFLKKGPMSAGVQRQYSGTAGRIENCQLGVFAAYATPVGRALVDAELYLPRVWTGDRDRCRVARIGDEVEFATKPELAWRMIERAIGEGVPFGWVAGDEAYGGNGRLRARLEAAGVGYVLAVAKDTVVATGWGRGRSGSWRRSAMMRCGNGVAVGMAPRANACMTG